MDNLLKDKALKLLKNHNIKKEEVINLYMYGSRVYGCNMSGDYDLIAVVAGSNIKAQIKFDDVDISIYSEDTFQELINKHEISILECIFLPKDKILQENKKFEFSLNLSTLRDSISSKTSNSFVKAKKKMMIEDDFYIGKKSLFHAMRILDFGIQIAQFKRIVDYGRVNKYWVEIVQNSCNDWNYYKEKYQGEYNSLKTKFKLVAPKDND